MRTLLAMPFWTNRDTIAHDYWLVWGSGSGTRKSVQESWPSTRKRNRPNGLNSNSLSLRLVQLPLSLSHHATVMPIPTVSSSIVCQIKQTVMWNMWQITEEAGRGWVVRQKRELKWDQCVGAATTGAPPDKSSKRLYQRPARSIQSTVLLVLINTGFLAANTQKLACTNLAWWG